MCLLLLECLDLVDARLASLGSSGHNTSRLLDRRFQPCGRDASPCRDMKMGCQLSLEAFRQLMNLIKDTTKSRRQRALMDGYTVYVSYETSG